MERKRFYLQLTLKRYGEASFDFDHISPHWVRIFYSKKQWEGEVYKETRDLTRCVSFIPRCRPLPASPMEIELNFEYQLPAFEYSILSFRLRSGGGGISCLRAEEVWKSPLPLKKKA